MNTLGLRNRQGACPVDLRQLRRMVCFLLQELLHLEPYELGIQLVTAKEMTSLNETFLRHCGPTDVITFDYRAKIARFTPALDSSPLLLHGDVIVCPEVAIIQARQFHSSWPSEIARYVVHGILHLQGYDDRQPAARHQMKRMERKLLNAVQTRYPLEKLIRFTHRSRTPQSHRVRVSV